MVRLDIAPAFPFFLQGDSAVSESWIRPREYIRGLAAILPATLRRSVPFLLDYSSLVATDDKLIRPAQSRPQLLGN